MSITTLQRSINRKMITTGLQGLRLPLTAVEKVAHKGGSTDWPPAVAFESFEATAKKVMGSLLRDSELVEQGRLQQAKVAELGEAERLEQKAELERESADAELAAKQQDAARLREQAEQRAEERAAAVEREKTVKQRQAADAARAREAAAAKADELRDRVVATQERAAKRTRIAAEGVALEAKSKALGAAKKAEALDEALEAKRAKRSG